MNAIERMNYLVNVAKCGHPFKEYKISISNICTDVSFYVYYNKMYDTFWGEANIEMDSPLEELAGLIEPILSLNMDTSDEVVTKMLSKIIESYSRGYTIIRRLNRVVYL